MTTQTRTQPRHTRARMALAFLALLPLTLISTGCGPKSFGPAFEQAPPPPPNRGRIYVYRADARSSLASVRVTIDGQSIGRFRDGEYQTLELPTGLRHVRAGLRGFGMLAWGWNDHRVRLTPGETVYLMVSVRLAAQEGPTSREMEIAGRDGGTASENVFIQRRSHGEALADLGSKTRIPDTE
jgi:hypothetical protein